MPNRFALAWRALTRPGSLVDSHWRAIYYEACGEVRDLRKANRDLKFANFIRACRSASKLVRIRAILDETDERRPR